MNEENKQSDVDYTLLLSESDKELFDGVIENLSRVENFNEFLRGCKALKVKQHFEAGTPVTQLYAKGAFFFIEWLEKRVLAVKKTKDKATSSKQSDVTRRAFGGRYPQ